MWKATTSLAPPRNNRSHNSRATNQRGKQYGFPGCHNGLHPHEWRRAMDRKQNNYSGPDRFRLGSRLRGGGIATVRGPQTCMWLLRHPKGHAMLPLFPPCSWSRCWSYAKSYCTPQVSAPDLAPFEQVHWEPCANKNGRCRHLPDGCAVEEGLVTIPSQLVWDGLVCRPHRSQAEPRSPEPNPHVATEVHIS
jgi:hypothetical protein